MQRASFDDRISDFAVKAGTDAADTVQVLKVPKKIKEMLMSHIIHRSFKYKPRVARRSEGFYIEDTQGKTYIDASGVAAVSCLGHSHPDVLAAMEAQIRELAYAQTGFFTTEVAETLADGLAADAPSDLNNVYFASGGSEAMESKLPWKYTRCACSRRKRMALTTVLTLADEYWTRLTLFRI